MDKNLVVGIVFIFRKAFDSVSHHVLLNRLQAIVKLLAIYGAGLKIT